MLRSRRQQFHTRIAQVIEKELPDLLATEPQIVARHRQEGGDRRLASELWLAAAEGALSKAAMQKAAGHAAAGIELLQKGENELENRALEMSLELAMATAIMFMEGYGSSNAQEHYQKAYALSESVETLCGVLPRCGDWHHSSLFLAM